jgi:hypothetical protein
MSKLPDLGEAVLPIKESLSERVSLMETDEDLTASQELPPPKLDYCVECKDQEVRARRVVAQKRVEPSHSTIKWTMIIFLTFCIIAHFQASIFCEQCDEEFCEVCHGTRLPIE